MVGIDAVCLLNTLMFLSEQSFQVPGSELTPIAQVVTFLGLACHIMLNLGDFICQMVSLIVAVVFEYTQRGKELKADQGQIIKQILTSIHDVLKLFNIDGKTTTFAMCPSCHKEYQPQISFE
jgi:nicotinamide riboside transporter PnuC